MEIIDDIGPIWHRPTLEELLNMVNTERDAIGHPLNDPIAYAVGMFAAWCYTPPNLEMQYVGIYDVVMENVRMIDRVELDDYIDLSIHMKNLGDNPTYENLDIYFEFIVRPLLYDIMGDSLAFFDSFRLVLDLIQINPITEEESPIMVSSTNFDFDENGYGWDRLSQNLFGVYNRLRIEAYSGYLVGFIIELRKDRQ